MRDLLPYFDSWLSEGRRFAVATVVRTWGSSPRPVGAGMAVRADGLVAGSVSGGCVEGAVTQAALECLAAGTPRRLSFGSVDPDALWELGLSCGGSIEVWVEPEPYNDPVWRQALESVRHGRPTVVASRLDPPGRALWTPQGTAGDERLAREARDAGSGASRLVEAGGREVFVQVVPSPDMLLIIGASHLAIPLIQLARPLGFFIVLVDPRAALLRKERFPAPPDETVEGWPPEALEGIEIGGTTAAVALSHDPRIDDPALAYLLQSAAGYVGALGSRSTQERRRESLAALGVPAAQIERLHGPVGLDIGARSPEEIAVSILAEIIKVRRTAPAPV